MKRFIACYLDDLRTDLRRPYSVLDALNMVLRRVNLILVRYNHDQVSSWNIHRYQRWMAQHGMIPGEDA